MKKILIFINTFLFLFNITSCNKNNIEFDTDKVLLKAECSINFNPYHIDYVIRFIKNNQTEDFTKSCFSDAEIVNNIKFICENSEIFLINNDGYDSGLYPKEGFSINFNYRNAFVFHNGLELEKSNFSYFDGNKIIDSSGYLVRTFADNRYCKMSDNTKNMIEKYYIEYPGYSYIFDMNELARNKYLEIMNSYLE